MYINFNGMDLAFGCRRIVFEWEGFGLESFWNDTSLSHTHIHTQSEREVSVPQS